MQANMFLNKMQIPFYVAIGVLFAVEIVISILRGQGTDQYVAYVNIILYLLDYCASDVHYHPGVLPRR